MIWFIVDSNSDRKIWESVAATSLKAIWYAALRLRVERLIVSTIGLSTDLSKPQLLLQVHRFDAPLHDFTRVLYRMERQKSFEIMAYRDNENDLLLWVNEKY